MLEEFNMCALNTFASGLPTWYSPSGTWSRIDNVNVCISTYVFDCVESVHTVSSFDLPATENKVHVPVMFDVSVDKIAGKVAAC